MLYNMVCVGYHIALYSAAQVDHGNRLEMSRAKQNFTMLLK